MVAIQFKPGMPLAGESPESAIQDADFFLKSLRRDVVVIKHSFNASSDLRRDAPCYVLQKVRVCCALTLCVVAEKHIDATRNKHVS